MRSKTLDFLAKYWLSVAFVVVTAILFKPAWWDGLLLGFRDTLHFYYPLWSHIDRLPLAEQILPLWNPLDGFGCSIVGEPTSMVFYPFRVILLLPIGNIEQRIGAFLLVHLWLSYSLWVYACSKLGFQFFSLQITGWAYSLSGPVFFQIYNPPFLVGSAWLPLAMFGVLKIANIRLDGSERISVVPNNRELLRSHSIAIGWLTLSLTMIVLGGDAQLAYHLAMISGIIVCFLPCQLRLNVQLSSAQSAKQIFFSIFSILVAFTLALGLTAIQSIPTRHWLELSERAGPIEVTSDFNERRLLGVPYLFSEAPWNYSTVLVSNVLGHINPTSTRWLVPFGAEPSTWSPSLHVGTLVFASAVAWWCTRVRASLSVVTLIVTFIAILSSFGRYNLYEVWNTVLPGYSQFRYAAKWTPFFVWGVCLAATPGIAHFHEPNIRKIVKRICCVIAVLGCLAASLNLLIYFSPNTRRFIYDLLSRSAKSRGVEMDLDVSQSVYFIGFGGFLATFTAIAIYTVLQWKNSSKALAGFGLITILELIIALQPVLIFVRPLTVDPMLGLKAETSTAWDHFTNAETTWQAKELLRERGINTFWKFGDMALPVLRAHDTPIARYDYLKWNTWELQAVDQGNRITGKLHLLRNFRSFQTYYTLVPRAIRLYCSSRLIDSEADSPAKPLVDDLYFLHHVTPITELPSWPPSVDPDSSNDHIQFSNTIMTSNRFDFDYDSPESFHLQLPILDDGGWCNARTDNEVLIVKGPEDLLTLQLAAGKHSIALRFFPPGLTLGGLVTAITSLIAVTLTIVLQTIYHHRKEA